MDNLNSWSHCLKDQYEWHEWYFIDILGCKGHINRIINKKRAIRNELVDTDSNQSGCGDRISFHEYEENETYTIMSIRNEALRVST